MGPEDFCHFGYQVERREIDSEVIEDGDGIDQFPWRACGEAVENMLLEDRLKDHP